MFRLPDDGVGVQSPPIVRRCATDFRCIGSLKTEQEYVEQQMHTYAGRR